MTIINDLELLLYAKKLGVLPSQVQRITKNDMGFCEFCAHNQCESCFTVTE